MYIVLAPPHIHVYHIAGKFQGRRIGGEQLGMGVAVNFHRENFRG